MQLRLGRLSPENRRRALALGDQAASSLTNVIVAILVMRSVGPDKFGAFSVALISYQIVIGLARALIGEPYLARHSGDSFDARRAVVAEIVGAAITVGVVCAVVIGGVGWALGGLTGPGLVTLAVLLPFLIVHDTLRFDFIVDKAGRALAIDLAWLILVVVVMAQAPGDADAPWFVAAWGASGAVAMVLGLAFVRASSWALSPLAWLRRTWSDGIRYAGDYLTAQAAAQIAVLSLSAVSLTTLGVVRASQTFYGPLNTVHLGIYLAVVPDGVRLRDRPKRLLRLIGLTAAGLTLLGACWTLVGVSIPDSIGREIADRSWPGADEIMLPMGLWVVLGGLTAAGFLGLRCLGDARASLRSRVRSAPGQLVLPIGGAVVGGPVGFALGLATARLLTAAIWWTAFKRALHGAGSASVADERPRSAGDPAVLAATADDG